MKDASTVRYLQIPDGSIVLTIRVGYTLGFENHIQYITLYMIPQQQSYIVHHILYDSQSESYIVYPIIYNDISYIVYNSIRETYTHDSIPNIVLVLNTVRD
jgi:hypothetical protein